MNKKNMCLKFPFLNFVKSFFGPKKLLKPRLILKISIIGFVFFLIYLFGLFTHFFEKDLKEFRHPLKVDVRYALKTIYKDRSSISYLDVNRLNYSFIHTAAQTCQTKSINLNGKQKQSKPYLIILVKSKLTHFKNREVIRKTWGSSDETKLIRTVFLLGLPSPTETNHFNSELTENDNSEGFNNKSILNKLELEYQKYGDIVQQDFYDTYYNNTIKTFMGIRWVNEYCANAKFYLFIDDDFYLNPNLLMKYLSTNVTESMLDTYYAGFVFDNSSPMRHLFSKWYISLNDYPYHKFPPYAAAGFYILSRQSANLFFMASKLIELFKFDDIYMGILAYKLDIKPLHIEMVHFWAPTYYPSTYAKEVIAAHGFSTTELISIWNQLENLIKFQPTKFFLDL